ncbi:hypothetical protein PROFUN_10222 [Planoprotostelium fungivorum]|uniref:Uncharacterized protein n=1 Tax=Planoprotostelium fungivorum TaxID=1890364 RepID=A0A2P6MQ87_9EUKA|nr:hypothetical protein PROFUN_10222 [Planoprotostelium fungivorum]
MPKGINRCSGKWIVDECNLVICPCILYAFATRIMLSMQSIGRSKSWGRFKLLVEQSHNWVSIVPGYSVSPNYKGPTPNQSTVGK